MNWLRQLFRSKSVPVDAAAQRLSSPDAEGSGNARPGIGDAAPFVRTAYIPEVDAGAFGTGSGFGGQPYLADGVSRPSCPRCAEAMPLVAQVDLAAQPAPIIAGAGLMQLFYCTRERDGMPCDVELEGWAAFSRAHVVRVVPAGPGGSDAEVDTPFEPQRVTAWTAAEDYPNWEELAALGADPGEPSDEPEAFPLEGEKLGGWPRWVQGIEYPSCPQCGMQMQLVLQVDSGTTLPTMWGDMGIGHVTQCPNHAEALTFAWAGS